MAVVFIEIISTWKQDRDGNNSSNRAEYVTIKVGAPSGV